MHQVPKIGLSGRGAGYQDLSNKLVMSMSGSGFLVTLKYHWLGN